MKIVFLDRSTLGPRVILRKLSEDHTYVEYQQTDSDDILERLQDAEIAILNKVEITASVLNKLPVLKHIAVAATGTDCVDKISCASRGVTVSNIREYALRTVPEHAFALMLALRRSIIPFRQDTINGEWQRAQQFCFFDHKILDLGGSQLGIIGEGVLGQRVAELGKAFGMKVMFAAHKGNSHLGPLYTPWDEVMQTSDVITLHAPLTPETRNMIDMTEFQKMKRQPLIINTARGGLIVEADLERALDDRLISGAGIDVTLPEPPPLDSVLMRIAPRRNVIITPHVAWASDEAMQGLADQLMDNIENFISGRPSNLVKGAY